MKPEEGMKDDLWSEAWRAGWLDGFLAAACLLTGRYTQYKKFRDMYLESKEKES